MLSLIEEDILERVFHLRGRFNHGQVVAPLEHLSRMFRNAIYSLGKCSRKAPHTTPQRRLALRLGDHMNVVVQERELHDVEFEFLRAAGAFFKDGEQIFTP